MMEKKRSVGVTIFVFLSLLLISALLLAIYFYTSVFEIFPWYDESSRGFQLLGIFIFVAPILLLVSLALHILGRYYNIKKPLKRIPLFALAGLVAPIFLSRLIQIVFLPFVMHKEDDAIKGINLFASNFSYTLAVLISIGFLIVSIKMISNNLTRPKVKE